MDISGVWCLSMPPWCWRDVSVIPFGIRLVLPRLQAYQGYSWLIVVLLHSCWCTPLRLALLMLRHPEDGNQLLLLQVLETSLLLPGDFHQLTEKDQTSVQYLQLLQLHHYNFCRVLLCCRDIVSHNCWVHLILKRRWHSQTAGEFLFCIHCCWYFSEPSLMHSLGTEHMHYSLEQEYGH